MRDSACSRTKRHRPTRLYAGSEVDHGAFRDLVTLRHRLDAHIAEVLAAARATSLNGLRAEVLAHGKARAELPSGLITLTVPTGGGMTQASLSFALGHAVRHGLRRIVYIIPFTSIIEQTAEPFRKARTSEDVLEHHASFDRDAAVKQSQDPVLDGARALQSHARSPWPASEATPCVGSRTA